MGWRREAHNRRNGASNPTIRQICPFDLQIVTELTKRAYKAGDPLSFECSSTPWIHVGSRFLSGVLRVQVRTLWVKFWADMGYQIGLAGQHGIPISDAEIELAVCSSRFREGNTCLSIYSGYTNNLESIRASPGISKNRPYSPTKFKKTLLSSRIPPQQHT